MAKKSESPWVPIPGAIDEALPGRKGSYAVFVGPPIVEGKPHFCHLSWQFGKWMLRDFIQGRMRGDGPDIGLEEVWALSKVRLRLAGELRVPVKDVKFWREKLEELTAEHMKKGQQA